MQSLLVKHQDVHTWHARYLSTRYPKAGLFLSPNRDSLLKRLSNRLTWSAEIMAKVKGPLLSLGASGQIGKSIVFADWRGVKYAREHVVPANPQTTAQTLTRTTFAGSDDQFKRMLTLAHTPWDASAVGKAFTARNKFISEFVRNLRGDADMTAYVGSPGVLGGLPLLTFSAVPGGASGEIDVAADVPPTPVDWTHDAVIYTAFLDRDPATPMTDFMQEIESLAAAWAPGPPPASTDTFTGLVAAADYAVTAFLRSTRADGVVAYGVSSTVIINALA